MEISSGWGLKKRDGAMWGKFHHHSQHSPYSIVCWRISVFKNPSTITKYIFNPAENSKNNLFNLEKTDKNLKPFLPKVYRQGICYVDDFCFPSNVLEFQ